MTKFRDKSLKKRRRRVLSLVSKDSFFSCSDRGKGNCIVRVE